MSRLTLAHPATRPADPGRVLILGAPGSLRLSKALMVASSLVELTGGGRLLVVDTNHPASLDAADVFDFEVLPWGAPHDPVELGLTLSEASDEFAAVVIDTTTDQWFGRGGVRELADSQGWPAARAAHADLLDVIRSSPMHVVGTCDTLGEYRVDDELRPVRVETEPRHDVGIEARWQVSLRLDAAQQLTMVNGPLSQVAWGPGEEADFALTYGEWLASGERRAPREVVEALRERVAALPDRAVRAEVRDLLRRRFTGPKAADLLVRDVEAANDLVGGYEPEAVPEPNPEPDPDPPSPDAESEAA